MNRSIRALSVLFSLSLFFCIDSSGSREFEHAGRFRKQLRRSPLVSVRDFDPSRIFGPYVYDNFSLPSAGVTSLSRRALCPRTIEFRTNGIDGFLTTGQRVSVLPHRDVALGGHPCPGSGILGFVNSMLVEENDNLFGNQLRQKTIFLYGVNRDRVQCGGFILEARTVMYLVYDADSLTFSTTSQGFALPKSTKMLFVFNRDLKARCAYRGVSYDDESSAWSTGDTNGKPAPNAKPSPHDDEQVNISLSFPSNGSSGSTSSGGTPGNDPEKTLPTSSRACFPGRALVELKNGNTLPIRDLRIGDEVRVSATEFSRVFFFTHDDETYYGLFIRICTDGLECLTVSPEHYLYARDMLITALEVKIGDEMTNAKGVRVRVVSVERVAAQGLYNPHTLHGNIVVNGIVASTLTSAVHPAWATKLLFPFKVLHWLGIVRQWSCRCLLTLGSSIAKYLPEGPRALEL